MSKFIRVGATNDSQVAGDKRTYTMINLTGNTVPAEYWADTGEVDVEGNPIYVNNFVQVASGTTIPKHPFIVLEDGSFQDTTPDEEKMQALVDMATEICISYIQGVIDAYNEANGVVFRTVHNCSSYINNPTYTHYPFCVDVWNWSVDVWEAARGIQSQIVNGEISVPETTEDFIALLPEYTGTTEPQGA